jgi:predicted Ser/Thr protein kinase
MTTVEQRCEARLGQVLKGKWSLERVLGIGGMAAVYVAQHKIGRREAIKILHPEVARDAEQRKRFEQEARAANQLVHPGIVEVRDIDITEDGCPFMVMELLEGETLSDLANRRGGLPPEETLAYVDEILDVLALAHEHGIVHRDIKLGNLFLTTEGRIKVLDFGIARLSSSTITRVGARLGTAAYMPPEQVRGESVDGRADLYAVGATMFRVLAKRRVHEAPTEAQLIVKTATVPAPLLATVCDAPANVCLVVDRALAFHADERYPDARTMQSDVQAVRRGERPPHASSPNAAAAARGGATRAEGAGARARVAASGPLSRTLGEGMAPPPGSASAEAFEPTGYAVDAPPPSVQVHVGAGVDVHEATGFGEPPGPPSARDLMPTVVPPAPGREEAAPGSMAVLSDPFSSPSRAVGAAAASPAKGGIPTPAAPIPTPRSTADAKSAANPSAASPSTEGPAWAVPGPPPPSHSGGTPRSLLVAVFIGATLVALAIGLIVAFGGGGESTAVATSSSVAAPTPRPPLAPSSPLGASPAPRATTTHAPSSFRAKPPPGRPAGTFDAVFGSPGAPAEKGHGNKKEK